MIYLPFLVQTVEAFEVMLLAILSAVLKCEWGLSSYQEAAITSVRCNAVHPREMSSDIMLANLYYFPINPILIVLLAQFVFVGFLIGCTFWGAFADRYGRKKVSPPCTVHV